MDSALPTEPRPTPGASRRDFLRGAAGAAAAALVGCEAPQRRDGGGVVGRPSAATPFRFVHLTDIHVQPEKAADQGFARALRAVEELRPRPDFILTGGDLVFDVFDHDATRAKMLFTLYEQVIADNTSIKVYHTVGNHDVFGWGGQAGVTPGAAGYGKAMVKDYLGLSETHYSFAHKGWRFFVLDNIQPAATPRGYEGAIDPAQREWLSSQLAGTAAETPIVTCEHIPLLSASPFAFEHYRTPDGWELPNALVCRDAVDRLGLYAGRRVRLALSGHLHQRDDVRLRGTTFVCGGAVCGNWWKGAYHGVEEGFGVVDLFADGRFEYRYHDYGWQARA